MKNSKRMFGLIIAQFLLMTISCSRFQQAFSSLKDDPLKVTFGQKCDRTYADESVAATQNSGRGMIMPWEEIQAEDADTNGLIIGPCRMKWDINHIEAEAIGRKAVVLQKTGDYVKFHTRTIHNSIVVRLSVPDVAGGGGADYTLGVYQGGKRKKTLNVTSKYSWNYLGSLMNDPRTDVPNPQPHMFFDEVRLRVDEGDEIELRRDAEDTAAFYVIDLVDFEKVGSEATMPDGYEDVTKLKNYNIKPDDDIDDGEAIERALWEYKKLYFPKGKYLVHNFGGLGNLGIDCNGCSIEGAGMWYTEFAGPKAMFFCTQLQDQVSQTCKFGNFSIIGTSTGRNEDVPGNLPEKGFAGSMGVNSIIENIWIEHVVAGIWVGGDPPNQRSPTDGLRITNCRVRDTYADGINFANGTSNSKVENCHIRNTGDDAIALWTVNWPDWVKEKPYALNNPDFIKSDARSSPGQGAGHGNTFSNITVQMPWRANCFGAYGGSSNTFENSTCEDVLTYPGILVDNEFSPYDFGPGLTTFRNITLTRAGGTMFYEGTDDPWNHGALKFYMREGSVKNILVENVDIISPTFSGIEFRGFGTAYLKPNERVHPTILTDAAAATIEDVTLRNVRVLSPGTYGVEIFDGGAKGHLNVENSSLSNPGKAFYSTGMSDPFFTADAFARIGLEGTAPDNTIKAQTLENKDPPDYLDRRLDQVSFLTAHNAFANRGDDAVFGNNNQNWGIEEQLQKGVRGLMLDLYTSDSGEAIICHSACGAAGTYPWISFTDELVRIQRFMDNNPTAIITIHMEMSGKPDVSSKAITGPSLVAAFDKFPITKNRIFDPYKADVQNKGWPTIRQMVDSDKRLLILAARDLPEAHDIGVAFDMDFTVENYWSMGLAGAIPDRTCKSRWDEVQLDRKEQGFVRLFVMNHFRDSPEVITADIDNGHGSLWKRIDWECLQAAGKLPNYVALDFVDQGSGREAVIDLNEKVRAIAYDYPNYQGQPKLILKQEYDNFVPEEDNVFSSIRILFEGTKISLYDDKDLQNHLTDINKSIPDLQEFGNKTSSLQAF